MKTKDRAAISIIAGALLGGYAFNQTGSPIGGIAIGAIIVGVVYFLTR